MAETFFGPWRVVVTEVDPVPRQGFEVSGSDNADGFYEPAAGSPADISVSGAKWTVEMRALLPFDGADWFTFDPVRTTRYLKPEGLTVRLNFGGDHVLLLGPFELRQTLLCILMDPDINPTAPPNPFDFTIPAG